MMAVGVGNISFLQVDAAPSDGTELQGHVRSVNDDLFGYYFSGKELRVGSFVFSMISLGGPGEFDAYENGKNEYESYAPFMLEFEDVSSAKKENELGQVYYENSPRVLPVAYKVSKEVLAFKGTDPLLGEVSFHGQLDTVALKKSQEGESPEIIVLTGDLTFAGETFRGVTFTWFGGD
mgnify:CR=1 FL=1